MKKVKMNSKKAQNAAYKNENRRDKNRLAKLGKANQKNPNDRQTAQAFVDLYHKLNG